MKVAVICVADSGVEYYRQKWPAQAVAEATGWDVRVYEPGEVKAADEGESFWLKGVDLKDLDLCYSPLYSTARDPVNQAALQATNLIEGKVRQVLFSQVRGLVEEGAYLLDVREKEEHDHAHIRGSVNIPLSQLRERLAEIPRDRPVYAYCRSGARSYNAVRAMMQEGIEAVNIAGSFLALSWHEYYQDRALNRPPVVTGYNFE